MARSILAAWTGAPFRDATDVPTKKMFRKYLV